VSNYSAPTRHPVTGKIEMADWLDDSFGHHIYGVRFHGEEKIYPGTDCVELGLNEMLKEVERLRDAVIEECAEVADAWLKGFKDQEITVVSAREWATDSVMDIRDAIRALASDKGET
jgi:hypothetical protein